MPSVPSFSYIVPVFNQELVLEHSVARLVDRLASFPGSEILLIENGSSDGSARICNRLAAELHGPRVGVRTATSKRGMGHAFRCGMQLSAGDIVVLTAADLPFGFSDLDAFLATAPLPRIALGSKAHPQSEVDVPPQRQIMSHVFRSLRAAILGLHVRDSQGTIFIHSRLSRQLLPHLACGDFLISTEVVCWALRYGATPVELPVIYPRSRGSTVSPLRDSARMLTGMLALRRRLRAAPRPATLLQGL
jgi:dolichyl-phosphate beta-glucosyltransferase